MSSKTTIPRKLPFFTPAFPLYVAKHRLSEKPTGRYALHWHDFFEIELVVGGRGEHCINSVSHPLSKGWLYLVKPTDRHSIVSDIHDPLEIFTVQFEGGVLSKDVLDRLLNAPAPLFTQFDGNEFDFLYQLLCQMVRHSVSIVEDSRAILKTMLSLFCLVILKNTSPEGMHATEGSMPFLIQKAISHIFLNIKNDLSIRSIANALGVSPNYLGTQFNRHTGSTINEYVNQLRIERGRQFILQTELSVQEISVEVGFNSASYFIRKFREQYGISPTSLRNS